MKILSAREKPILFYVNALAQKKLQLIRLLVGSFSSRLPSRVSSNFLEEKRPVSRRKCGKCIQKEFESLDFIIQENM